jgi:hypothetical protein
MTPTFIKVRAGSAGDHVRPITDDVVCARAFRFDPDCAQALGSRCAMVSAPCAMAPTLSSDLADIAGKVAAVSYRHATLVDEPVTDRTRGAGKARLPISERRQRDSIAWCG